MEALVIHAPGDLRVEQIETPPLAAGQLRVKVTAGGICGSDLHYFQHGGFGTVRIKEPMVLGHEVAGTSPRPARGHGQAAGRPADRHQPEPALRPLPLRPIATRPAPSSSRADRSQAMKVLLSFD